MTRSGKYQDLIIDLSISQKVFIAIPPWNLISELHHDTQQKKEVKFILCSHWWRYPTYGQKCPGEEKEHRKLDNCEIRQQRQEGQQN